MKTLLPAVAMATITLARTEEESEMLRASLAVLARSRLPVFIADGGSLASLTDYLRNVESFHLLPQPYKGVQAQGWASVQTAFAENFEWVIYTEPDKKDFFDKHLRTLVQQARAANDPGLILAARNAEAFQTFAAFQQTTETCINDCCAEALCTKTDYCYGPFALHREAWEKLSPPVEDLGWGWRPYVFGGVRHNGFAASVFEGDFGCPPDQRSDDATERLYRMKQLEQNIRGLLAAERFRPAATL